MTPLSMAEVPMGAAVRPVCRGWSAEKPDTVVRQFSALRPDSTGTATAIACAGLRKDYGGGHGVFYLDLVVRRGGVFGFIGPNGAGRTTTIRLLMDLVRPHGGTATLLGLDSRRESVAVKRRVGYLPGELVSFPGVSAGYVVGLLAGLRGGIDSAWITALAQRFDLDLGRRYETPRAMRITTLAVFVAASYLLVCLVPLLGRPDWVDRTTIFGAYGEPYLELPAASGLAVLAAIAAGGGLLAAALAQRSPKAAPG